jgi:hypothetical protein
MAVAFRGDACLLGSEQHCRVPMAVTGQPAACYAAFIMLLISNIPTPPFFDKLLLFTTTQKKYYIYTIL